MVSKTRKYIDFDISGLQDRYIDLHDGLRIESPLFFKYNSAHQIVFFLKTQYLKKRW